MPTPTFARLGGAIALAALLAACNRDALPVAPNPGTGGTTGQAGKPVTFTVTAAANAFSDKKQITLAVWDSEQLRLAEQSAGCTVSFDTTTGKETTSCPPGVTPVKPTPEETIVSRADLEKGVTIVSRTVTTGERYRVTVGGMAADDCNSAGGSSEGTAQAEALKLAIVDIAQTMMACVPTRGQ